MTGIVDYGVGNLFSLRSSFHKIGEEVIVTADKKVLESTDRILLPGVGAFEDAIKKLRETGLDVFLKEAVKKGKVLMGICLGMQLLFEESFEYGKHKGLALLKGSVAPMEGFIPKDLKIPHIGWNQLNVVKPHPLLKNIKMGDCAYFVHSYHAVNCEDSLICQTEYGKNLTAAVGKDNVLGCQFHPEKSGDVGLNILRAFCEVK